MCCERSRFAPDFTAHIPIPPRTGLRHACSARMPVLANAVPCRPEETGWPRVSRRRTCRPVLSASNDFCLVSDATGRVDGVQGGTRHQKVGLYGIFVGIFPLFRAISSAAAALSCVPGVPKALLAYHTRQAPSFDSRSARLVIGSGNQVASSVASERGGECESAKWWTRRS